MTSGSSYRGDFYQILGLEDHRYDTSLPTKTIRIAYKRALLVHHPDKQPETKLTVDDTTLAYGALSNEQSKTKLSVDEITLAYRVLSDIELRREYDYAIQSSDRQVPNKFKIYHAGLDTFDLDDLKYDAGCWTKPCRCGDGGGFIIKELELEQHVEDGELITGCKGCSLWIKVLFSVEE